MINDKNIKGINSLQGIRPRRSLINLLMETTVDNFLFYFAFVCFSIAEILVTTAFITVVPLLGRACNVLLYCSVVMLFLRMLIVRATSAQWIAVFVIAVLAAFLGMRYGFQYPVWIFLFVVSGRGVNLRTLAKITLVLAGTLTILTLLACYAGFLENYTMVATGARAARSSMGFTHPNRLGERIAEVCIAYWCLNVDKHKGRVVTLCLVSLVYVYLVANSRTSCIVFAGLIVAALAYPLLAKYPRLSILASCALVTLVAGASLFLMAEYNPLNKFMTNLNDLVTGRLYLMNASYRYAAPSLFGNDYSGAPVMGYTIATGREYHFVVDNAYAHLIMLYGIVATVLFFLLIGLVYLYFYRERRFPVALLGLTVLLAVGFVENFTLDIQYNYFLFLISDVIFLHKEAFAFSRAKGKGQSEDSYPNIMPASVQKQREVTCGANQPMNRGVTA